MSSMRSWSIARITANMEVKALQSYVQQSGSEMKKPFGTATEIILALVEELGEVSQEIALIEQIGSKAEWAKQPSKERLAEELMHVLNVILALANFYKIDLDKLYAKKLNS